MVVTNLLLLYNFTTHLIFCSISFTALQIKKQTWSLSSWSWLDILTQSRKVNRIDPFQFIMLVAGTLRLGIHLNTEGWQNTELSITRLSDLRSHETRKHTHFALKGSSPFDVLFKHKCNNIPVFTGRLEISKKKTRECAYWVEICLMIMKKENKREYCVVLRGQVDHKSYSHNEYTSWTWGKQIGAIWQVRGQATLSWGMTKNNIVCDVPFWKTDSGI